MRSENGIPRPEQPNALGQKVRDLERQVKRLAARRIFVNLERVTASEGGKVDPAVGAQLTETVQEQIVIGGENLAPDALDNKALYGSSVTAVGEYTAGDLVNPDNVYNPRRQVQTYAVLDARPDPDALSGRTRWPGVYLESVDPAVPVAAPYQPARLVGGGSAAQLFSLQETPTSPKGEVTASPSEAAIRATGDAHPVNKLPGTSSTAAVGADSFRVETTGQPDIIGKYTASVVHAGDGVLRLNGGNGVEVNGVPLSGGGGGGGIQHAEFTTSFNLPSTTAVSRVAGSFSRDQGQDKNGGFASVAGPGSLTLQPGVYAILYRADCGSSMGDVARLGLWNATQTNEYTASAVKTGEWDGTLQHPNLYLPNGATIVFNIRQNSGSSRTCNVRVVLEKK